MPLWWRAQGQLCLSLRRLASVRNQFVPPLQALIALSFTFYLHTLLSRFFRMLVEPSKPSFIKVILGSIIILRRFCCCYREWKISLFVCIKKLKLLLHLFSNDFLIHVWEVCRKRDCCLLGSDAMYCRSSANLNRLNSLVTVVRISLKYNIFWPCCWGWLFSCVCWSVSANDMN